MAENTELTTRETEILALIAEGKSNKEIAAELVISINTVKVHVSNIFQKIEVSSRTEATLYAIEQGIVQSPLAKDYMVEHITPQQEGIVPQLVNSKKKTIWIALLVVATLVVGLYLVINKPNQPSIPNPLLDSLNQSRWLEMPGMLTPRSDFAVTTFDNAIYVIGGHGSEGVVGKVERFNLNTNQWELLQEKPVPVEKASAVVYGGKIYVLGGQLLDGTPTNILEVYNPRTNSWSSQNPIPTPIYDYAIATYEGNIFVFGGVSHKSEQDSVYRYSPESDTWKELNPMPSPRTGATAITLDQSIFIVGGICDKIDCKAIDVYHPNQEVVDENPWTQQITLDSNIQFIGAEEVSGSLFLFGFLDSGELQVKNYTQQNNSWHTYAEDSTIALSNHAQSTSLNGEVYFIGGLEPDGTPTNKVVRYQAVFTIVLPKIAY